MYIIVNICQFLTANLFKSTEGEERPKAFHGECTVALSYNAWLDTKELPGIPPSASMHYVFDQDIFNTCLLLIQPMKNHPDITENVLTGT